MTWGNNLPFGVNPQTSPGQPNPPYYLAGFQSVLAAMSAGVLPANIQITGVSSANPSPGTGNPTLLQAIGQGAQINGGNGIQAPVNAYGGSTAFVPPDEMANVPPVGTVYGGN
jgi:hypothetical protein